MQTAIKLTQEEKDILSQVLEEYIYDLEEEIEGESEETKDIFRREEDVLKEILRKIQEYAVA
ncbi:MAG: hypothetical protein M0Z52_05475 [Actinomycetota bacterium]|nr:hypothetical protein [Actinomycetota bacterium]MDA8173045.1 hypothetical protein [Nitrospiraceae bacterium]